MSIPFTQFLMPDGRRQEIKITRPKGIEDNALALIGGGVRFEAEMLQTGEISLCAEWLSPDGDNYTLANELCDNGPDVPVAVDRLVQTTCDRWPERFKLLAEAKAWVEDSEEAQAEEPRDECGYEGGAP